MQFSPLWQQYQTFLTCSQFAAKSLQRLPLCHAPTTCFKSQQTHGHGCVCGAAISVKGLSRSELGVFCLPLHYTTLRLSHAASASALELGLWFMMACLHPLLINIQASSCSSSLVPLALSTSRIKGVQQQQQQHFRGWGKQLLQQSPNSACRSRRISIIQSSQSPAMETKKAFEVPSGRTPLEMTYLEGNSWLWKLNGMNILVDPVLVGNLDFGIPFLYDATKKSEVMKKFTLDDLPNLDCILITQGFDDHCHKTTLQAMLKRFSEVRVIASPNAESIMGKLGYHNVTYLEPNDSTTLGDIHVHATKGPVLGPPWQRPENGYFLTVPNPKYVLYYEPHCIFDKANLDIERADVIVTPVNKQVLPAYTLVSGQEDAVKLAKFLQPKYLVTMKNAELDSRGLLSMIVSERGTVDSFKEMLWKEVPNVEVLEPLPGVPFEVPILSIVGSK